MFKSIVAALLFSIFITGSDHLITGIFSWSGFGLFFLFILFVTSLCKYYKMIYLLLLIFNTIHQLFFSYFHRTITSTDIYLFFTHIEETFESFYTLPSLFLLPFFFLLSGLFLLWILPRPEHTGYPSKSWIKYPVLLLLVMINLNSTMGLQLIDTFLHLSFQKPKLLHLKESPLYPDRNAKLNIILLIGESMKFDNYVESKLKTQHFFYKKIYSGATNTDVALPLLLNAKTNPLELTHTNETNLFKLAKKNHFTTAFISIQSEKSLKYIKPYLQTEHIDHYKSYTKKERDPKFDLLLFERLKKIDFSKNNFTVLQQIGQHSPYYYFEGEKSDNQRINYERSVDYSFKLYDRIYHYLKNTQKAFIFIYVSDHGEFTGEDGHYGHNSFNPIIYNVPMFIVSDSTLPSTYKNIRSHYQLSQFLTYLLGYKKKLEFSKRKSIVNGTMLSREDGFIEVQ